MIIIANVPFRNGEWAKTELPIARSNAQTKTIVLRQAWAHNNNRAASSVLQDCAGITECRLITTYSAVF
jgi:hypothetical protein